MSADAPLTQVRRQASSRRRALQIAIALFAIAVSLLVSRASSVSTPPVLADTSSTFSLDLEVLASVDDLGLIYAVEQRARPAYRILSFDPATGAVETVLTVPEDAIVHGIDLSPDRTTLAVAWSTDHALGGNGIWLLDLATAAEVGPDAAVAGLVEVVGITSDIYLVDPAWSIDATAVLATRVDRTGDAEQLSVVSIDTAGSTTMLAEDAIEPAVSTDAIWVLEVADETSARRSIASVGPDGALTTVATGGFDLAHLLAGANAPIVAAIDTGEGGWTIGAAAWAHGNHDVPSLWWQPGDRAPVTADAVLVYDADLVDGHIVEATREGLSVLVDGTRTELIASRALRMVTG